MARLISTVFSGVLAPAVDNDAPIGAISWETVIGDIALLYDKATGNAAHADTINHSGSGRGAFIRQPYVNQYIGGRPLRSEGTAKATYSARIVVWAAPIFFPDGIAFDVWLDGPMRAPCIELWDNTGAIVVSQAALTPIDDTLWMCAGTILSSGTGIRYLVITADVDETADSEDELVSTVKDSLIAVTVGPQILPMPHSAAGLIAPEVGLNTPGRILTTASPSLWFAYEDIYSEWTPQEAPINSRLLSFMNCNLNALQEALTGAPVNGRTYQLVDSSTTAPTTTRFLCHSGKTYATEPRVSFPLYVEGLGAALYTGGFATNAANTSGVLRWFAPYLTVITLQTVHRARILIPDFEPTLYQLRCEVLVCSGGGTPTNWELEVNNVTLGLVSSRFSPVLMSSGWYRVDINDIAHSEDVENTLELRIIVATGVIGSYQECGVVGVCYYLEPI